MIIVGNFAISVKMVFFQKLCITKCYTVYFLHPFVATFLINISTISTNSILVNSVYFVNSLYLVNLVYFGQFGLFWTSWSIWSILLIFCFFGHFWPFVVILGQFGQSWKILFFYNFDHFTP